MKQKLRDPETGELIDVPSREELGMHRGESMTFPVWILIAVSIFMGIVVGMIGITDTVLEVCK